MGVRRGGQKQDKHAYEEEEEEEEEEEKNYQMDPIG